MKTKLWEKETKTDKLIEHFTVGKDRELDLKIAPYDVIASKAHANMLSKVGLITHEESAQLINVLQEIAELLTRDEFKINEGVEDIHSQIEFYLTEKLGETGKKIHTARSRNDQVLTAIKLYLKNELKEIEGLSKELQKIFYSLSKEHKLKLMPGYTHFQIAMPSSFGLWFGAYGESLEEDIEIIKAAYKICDKNPLGSGAGFGSSFSIDRNFTTLEMGFAQLNENSVYAQMTRGKTEKIVAMALSNVAATLSKFSYDVCLYLSQNFGFISFPEQFTTGSSIMPHKKNPDVFELIRAKCNLLQGLPNQFTLLTNNLPSGYHRDMQLTKEVLFPAIDTMKDCLQILIHILPSIEIKNDILQDKKYEYLFSVEEVNKLVIAGKPFREAYQAIADQIKNGTFTPDKKIKHTHIGSIGN